MELLIKIYQTLFFSWLAFEAGVLINPVPRDLGFEGFRTPIRVESQKVAGNPAKGEIP